MLRCIRFCELSKNLENRRQSYETTERVPVNVPVIVDVDVKQVPVERLAIIEVFLDCADEPEADYVCKANEWLSWLKQAFV